MAEITSAKATARTVRVSPRKSRLVLDNIRGKSVADAIAILKFTPNKAAGIIEGVLNSAIANAENNFGLEKANGSQRSIRKRRTNVETFPSTCERFSFTN